MNLLDILNQILNTKKEIQDIIEENNNIARYSVTLYNLFVERYNQGYNDGCKHRSVEVSGIERYGSGTKAPREYNYNTPTSFDPFTVNGLYTIMEEVLTYKLDIKDVLGTDSLYWPEYPELIRVLLNTVYEEGYSKGEEDVDGKIIDPEIEVQIPTASFSNNVLTLATGQVNAIIYYYFGSSSDVRIRYTGPVVISETVTVYYYAKMGAACSEVQNIQCSYNPNHINIEPETDQPVERPTRPAITINKKNLVTIKGGNSNDVIYYKVNDGAYTLYTIPFSITENSIVYAYAIRNNVVGPEVNVSLTYTPPEEAEDPIVPKCSAPVYNQDVNTISLYCSTNNATIYYRLGSSGEYSVYTESFELQQDTVDLYTYATCEGYEDSQVKRYTLIKIVVVEPPKTPEFYMVQPEVSSNLHIWTSSEGAYIKYRFNVVSDWITVEYNHANIYPQNDCIVYARAYDPVNDLWSDEAVYQYTWYSEVYSLPAPSLRMVNNRVYVEVEEGVDYSNIYFTTDGGDPIGGNVYSLNYNRSNIVINDPGTVVKVRLQYIDDNLVQRWSNISSGVFSPSYDEEDFDYSFEYFNVLGAHEIHLTGVVNATNYVMSWSYDKTNWSSFQVNLTGLDKTKRIYLKTYGATSYRLWDSIYFGEGDEVTVSGSIVSLIWPDSFTDHNTVDKQMVFRGVFEGCKEIVDAKNLIIPITNSYGYDYEYMFKDCSNLIYAPETPIPCKNYAKYAFYQCFKGCSKLKSGFRNKFESIGDFCCKEMYSGCSAVEKVDSFVLSGIGKNSMEECFKGCSSLQMVSVDINDDLKEASMKSCFEGCSSLNPIVSFGVGVMYNGININSLNIDNESLYRCFKGCSSLSGFGTINMVEAKERCCYEMFYGCSSLERMTGIGFTRGKANTKYSMYGMFEGCSSLINAPELKISDLNSLTGIYERMFYGCSSLKYIKALFLTDPMLQYQGQTDVYWPYTRNWVYGVAESGTFVQSMDAAWFRKGVNAIPESWVENSVVNIIGRITSIVCDYDKVSIQCDNNDAIYYRINSDDDDEGSNVNWTLYTGPFILNNNAYVYAKCLSSRGTYGDTYGKLIEISVPKLVFTQSGNTVTISAVEGYVYTDIIYRTSTNSGSTWSDYTHYDGPVTINKNTLFQAYGLKTNGENGPVSSYAAKYSLGLVSISCYNNVVTLSADTVDNFNAGESGDKMKIQYKIDNGGWTDYPSAKFVISSTCNVKARVAYYHLLWTYGDESEATCYYDENGQSYVLDVPVFKQRYVTPGGNITGNPNIIYCEYPVTLAKMAERGIKIMYRMNNGAWRQWIFNTDSYAGTYTIITENTTIDTYAIIEEDDVQSSTVSYNFAYTSGYEVVTVPDPEITVISMYNYDYVYVTCSDSRATCFVSAPDTVNLRGWMTVKAGDGISLYNAGNPHSFVIKAYAAIDTYQSNIVSYNYSDSDSYDPGDPDTQLPAPIIRCSNNIVSIQNIVQDADIYYSFDDINYNLYLAGFSINSSRNVYAYIEVSNKQSNKTITWVQYEDLNPITVPVVSCVENYITMSNSTQNSTIYYRLNNTGSYVQYVSPIAINADTIVEAYTSLDGRNSSTVLVECQYVEPVDPGDWLTLTVTRSGKVIIRLDNYDTNILEDTGFQYQLNNGDITDAIFYWDNSYYVTGAVFNLNAGDSLKLRNFWTKRGRIDGMTTLRIGRMRYDNGNGYIAITPENTAEYILSGKIEALIDRNAMTQDIRTYFGVKNIFWNGRNILDYSGLDMGSYTAAELGLIAAYQPVVVPNDPTIEFNNVSNQFTVINNQPGVSTYYCYEDLSYDNGNYTLYTGAVTISRNIRVYAYSKYIYGNETLYSNKVSLYCEVVTPRVLVPTISYILYKDDYDLMEVTIHDNNTGGYYNYIEFEYYNNGYWLEFYDYYVSENKKHLRFRWLNAETNNKHAGAMVSTIYGGYYLSWPQIGGPGWPWFWPSTSSNSDNAYNMIDWAGGDLLFRYAPAGGIIKARAWVYAPRDPEADVNGYKYSSWVSVEIETI